MPQNVIAIDLGGTNLRAGIVDANGTISKQVRSLTPNSDTAAELAGDLAKTINDLRDGEEIQGVGLGLAAVVDSNRNRVSTSPNLPRLNNFDFAAEIGSQTGLEVYLENDATAAAIGEHWLGAGKDANHLICITLGTGVGGGLIVDGKPVYGAAGNAGEVGHICLNAEGPACGCGSNGCLEQYASGTAIVRMTRELISEYPDSPLHSRFEFTSEDVHEAAVNGDMAAIQAFENAGRHLGTALAGLVNLLNPEIIVITGGVASAWELFIGETRKELRKRAFHQPAEHVKIVRGTLGDHAGVLGAAKRAFSGTGFS
jgi:glucokinase